MTIRSTVIALGLVAASFAASAQAQRFVVSADGQEVQDTQTSLVWKRCVEGQSWDGKACKGSIARFKFSAAKDAADKAGKGWRVPTRDELKGLVMLKQKAKPMVDADAFPNQPKALYWAKRPGFEDNLNAYIVDFNNGKSYGNTGSQNGLRLVRDGK